MLTIWVIQSLCKALAIGDTFERLLLDTIFKCPPQTPMRKTFSDELKVGIKIYFEHMLVWLEINGISLIWNKASSEETCCPV